MRTVIVALIALAPLASGCAHSRSQVKREPLQEVTPAEVAHEDRVAAAAEPCSTVFAHFDLDSALIQRDDEAALQGAAACLHADRDAKIIVEGNADERGTEEYNLALGERRAVTVARYIKSLGASPAQVHTVSYGESKPECNEHNEGCWAKNRRVAIGPDNTRGATVARADR